MTSVALKHCCIKTLLLASQEIPLSLMDALSLFALMKAATTITMNESVKPMPNGNPLWDADTSFITSLLSSELEQYGTDIIVPTTAEKDAIETDRF
ncbi:hypothetical protein VNO77_43714 [Canavalia gladiata]|uniref:Uncharacterized protein n=1 Tax=Canavalia gladiata TaxID=3824 RepID=A0AAN9JVB2_CANGL